MLRDTIKRRLRGLLEDEHKIVFNSKNKKYLSFQLRNIKAEITTNETNFALFSKIPDLYGYIFKMMLRYNVSTILTPLQLEHMLRGTFHCPSTFLKQIQDIALTFFPNYMVKCDRRKSIHTAIHDLYKDNKDSLQPLTFQDKIQLEYIVTNLVPVLRSISMEDILKVSFENKKYMKVIPEFIHSKEDSIEIQYISNIKRLIHKKKLRNYSKQIRDLSKYFTFNIVLESFDLISQIINFVPFKISMVFTKAELTS